MLAKKNRGGKVSKKPTIEVLDELYQKHTAVQIAEMYGVSPSTVRTWIANYRKELKNQGDGANA